MNTTEDVWLTTEEVAEQLRTPAATVRFWRHRGEGPKGTKFGRRVLYRASDLQAWIAEQERSQHGAA